MLNKFIDAVKVTLKMADEDKPVWLGCEYTHVVNQVGQIVLSTFY